jgi:hypothetical protein
VIQRPTTIVSVVFPVPPPPPETLSAVVEKERR